MILQYKHATGPANYHGAGANEVGKTKRKGNQEKNILLRQKGETEME
jgi:hypothetical protein